MYDNDWKMKAILQVTLFNSILKELEEFEGKKISKRIETKMQELHPEYRVSYHVEKSIHTSRTVSIQLIFSEFSREEMCWNNVLRIALYMWNKKGDETIDTNWIYHNDANGGFLVDRIKAYSEWVKTKKEELDDFNSIDAQIKALREQIDNLLIKKTKYNESFHATINKYAQERQGE